MKRDHKYQARYRNGEHEYDRRQLPRGSESAGKKHGIRNNRVIVVRFFLKQWRHVRLGSTYYSIEH